MGDDIRDWQRRFFAAPRIWCVLDPDGVASGFYESKEAADVELVWRRRHGDRGYRLMSENVHSMELSVERWREPTSAEDKSEPKQPTSGEGSQ